MKRISALAVSRAVSPSVKLITNPVQRAKLVQVSGVVEWMWSIIGFYCSSRSCIWLGHIHQRFGILFDLAK